MLSQSDAISLQVMFASRYQGFINDKMLASCKRGQVWVGISRSHLFDPPALARALTDGRIEAAMLDGGQSNFATKGSPLYQIPNLFLTPKLGSFTLETRARASWYVAQRVHEALTTPHSGPESVPHAQLHLDAQVSALGPISGPASLDDR